MGTLIVISGNGTGAGKTTLARRLYVGAVLTALATGLREHVARLFPEDRHHIMGIYAEDKAHVLPDGRTVREALIEEGAAGRSYDKYVWCNAWSDRVKDVRHTEDITVDDVRTVTELMYLRRWAADHGRELLHLHLHHEGAAPEPFDDLSAYADYLVRRS